MGREQQYLNNNDRMEIKKYYRAGKSVEEIATLTGISESLIRQHCKNLSPFSSREMHRCPSCGGMVLIPCYACRISSQKEKK